MITLRESADGVLLPIHAKPGSSRDAILGVHDERLKVTVCAVAEKGKANNAIVKLLSKQLHWFFRHYNGGHVWFSHHEPDESHE